jgi:hypothetical protein
MRCKCCDKLLTEWESKAKDPADRTKYLDLCSVCKYHSSPFSWLDEEDTLKKEDISIDSG